MCSVSPDTLHIQFVDDNAEVDDCQVCTDWIIFIFSNQLPPTLRIIMSIVSKLHTEFTPSHMVPTSVSCCHWSKITKIAAPGSIILVINYCTKPYLESVMSILFPVTINNH